MRSGRLTVDRHERRVESARLLARIRIDSNNPPITIVGGPNNRRLRNRRSPENNLVRWIVQRIRQRSAVKIRVDCKSLRLSGRGLRRKQGEREGRDKRQARKKAAMHRHLMLEGGGRVPTRKKALAFLRRQVPRIVVGCSLREYPIMKHISHLLLVISIGIFSSSCSKKEDAPPPAASPTEKLTVVKADAAPCINGLRPSKEPMAVLRKGDLVYVRSENKGHLAWKNKIDGVEAKRDSDMVIISRFTSTDEQLYAFTQDLGEVVDAPTPAVICAEIDRLNIRFAHVTCLGGLQRHRSLSGHTTGFVVCNESPCPIATVDHNNGSKVNVVTVDGMIDVRPMIIDGHSMLLTSRRYRKDDGKWTGGALVPVDLSGPVPALRKEIPLDDIDARDATLVRTRLAQFELKGNQVRVYGDRIVTERETGTEKSREPFEETHSLTAAP